MVEESARIPLLSISGLVKRFGPVTAVYDVNLDVFRGDFISVFGPNGAGKSTLLRMLAHLSQPSGGTVQFSEEGDSYRGNVGYVSHQSLLYAELTGSENLEFFSKLYGIEDPVARAEELLLKMNLKRARSLPVSNYSSGMKQRLSIARALIHEPQLLLLDEPYAGLDQHGSRLLSEILMGLRDEGRTVVMITHNLGEGLSLCNRAVIMSRGQKVFDARQSEIDAAQFEALYFGMVEG